MVLINIDILELSAPKTSVQASKNVKQTRSSQSQHLKEDLSPAAVTARDDDDSCLKLDLRGLIDQVVTPRQDQNISPLRGSVAMDSARTLADVPEDVLMSARTPTAGTNLGSSKKCLFVFAFEFVLC